MVRLGLGQHGRVLLQVDVDRLADLVGDGDVVVLSGAGLSTESGIPDYRGPTGAARPATPMTYQEFTASPSARQRYWARSHLGWPAMSLARPNSGHLAVTELQARGLLAGVITQNVDGLHTAAGTRDVLQLHGALSVAVCLSCGSRSPRSELALRLAGANPGAARPALVRPDGDAEMAAADLAGFVVVPCLVCGGVLKPDVVFFGETVPLDRVTRAYALVEAAGALLVLGSSLTVMSGYRFVRRAAALGVPVAIVNQGPTRGDAEADLLVDAPLGELLPELLRRLA